MIISLEEQLQEELELEKWMDEENIPLPNLDQIDEVLKNPPKRCDEKYECTSYYLSHDCCRCIRSLFPHKTHYDLWKMLAEEKIQSDLAKAFEKQHKEENST